MKAVYSRRALSDLEQIALYYSSAASLRTAEAIGARLRDVIGRLAASPSSAPRLSQRSQVRSVAVVRYPFRIFYRVRTDAIEVLHIRHTSRRPARDLG